jgi:hypothetical protein
LSNKARNSPSEMLRPAGKRSPILHPRHPLRLQGDLFPLALGKAGIARLEGQVGQTPGPPAYGGQGTVYGSRRSPRFQKVGSVGLHQQLGEGAVGSPTLESGEVGPVAPPGVAGAQAGGALDLGGDSYHNVGVGPDDGQLVGGLSAHGLVSFLGHYTLLQDRLSLGIIRGLQGAFQVLGGLCWRRGKGRVYHNSNKAWWKKARYKGATGVFLGRGDTYLPLL